jgi:DUF1680 family protein
VRSLGEKTPADDASIKAIPYFAWASREPAAMRVWLKSG